MIGPIGPRPDGLDAPYWDGLADGRLVLQHCPACDRLIWGPQPACPRCHRLDPEWAEVAPEGTIFSWTRTWQPFTPELRDIVPFVTVVVELAAGPRLVGRLDGDADFAIGTPVAGTIEAGGVRWRVAVT